MKTWHRLRMIAGLATVITLRLIRVVRGSRIHAGQVLSSARGLT
ncbi:hypothetical protein [Atlantibacter hermannii]|nr:hypothetical protein [Atlantibacter hermannii]